MKKFSICIVIAGLTLFLDNPANAAVRYEFTANSSFEYNGEKINGGGFTFDAPNFVSHDLSLPLASLTSCSVSTTVQPSGGSCQSQDLYLSASFNYFGFGINTTLNPQSFIYYYFAPEAFGAPGTYDSIAFAENSGRLVVTELAGAVPEPSTWAMMLVGFGAIGTAMRRRKAVVSLV